MNLQPRISDSSPLVAEISQSPGQWYVVVTGPNQEAIAASQMAGRRFGVYLPMVQEMASTGLPWGRKRQSSRPMFPGYVFVFCWDLPSQIRRIRDCAGVTGILASDGLPAAIADSIIEQVRITENQLNPLFSQPRNRRKRRRYVAESGDEVVSVRTWSAFRDIAGMNGDSRNGLLKKVLGL